MSNLDCGGKGNIMAEVNTYAALEEQPTDELENVVQELKDILATIKDVCTYRLLDKARSRKSIDYNAKQYSNRGEELLALDREAEVPNNTEETKLFECIVHRFAHRLAQHLSTRRFTTDCGRELQNFAFAVKPIGSYPINAKIGDMDEFDFLLLIENSEQVLVIQEDWILRIYGGFHCTTRDGKNVARLGRQLHEFLLADLSSMMKTDTIGLNTIYVHGPAVCLEVGWSCQNGHTHEVSIDLTIGLEVPSMPLKDYLQTYEHYISKQTFAQRVKAPFTQLLFKVSQEEKCMAINYTEWVFTSSVYDRHLMAIVNGVSKNILPVYRLLKVICGRILPHKVGVTDRYNARGYNASCILSSHQLKSLVFHHVITHPTEEEWSLENIAIRLVEILKIAQEGWIGDLITGTAIGVEDMYMFKEDISALIDYITTEALRSEPPVTLSINYVDMVLVRGGEKRKKTAIHKCLETQVCQLDQAYIYPKSSLYCGHQTYNSHPLIQWCRCYLHKIYEQKRGSDFTDLHNKELGELWWLYVEGFLTKTDLDAGCREEVGSFGALCERTNVTLDEILEEYFDLYIDVDILQWIYRFPICDLDPLFLFGVRNGQVNLRDKLTKQGQALWYNKPRVHFTGPRDLVGPVITRIIQIETTHL